MNSARGTAVITGANRGIGLATARELARAGHRILLVCRDRERGQGAADSLSGSNHHVVVADLASLASVSQGAEQIAALAADGSPRGSLAALVNNAAVIPQERRESQDGFELQLAVTHLAHFLLTRSLLPLLRRSSSPARVVTVSSGAHFGPPFNFADPGFRRRPYRRLSAYQQSKLANVLFALALARRVASTPVQALALHPGVYDTGLFRDYMGRFPGGGAVARIAARKARASGRILAELAAGHRGENLNGAYFHKSARAAPSREAQDREDQERLWAWSSEAVGLDPAAV